MVCGSGRVNSQSRRLADYVAQQLVMDYGVEVHLFDLAEMALPAWNAEKELLHEPWPSKWTPVSTQLAGVQGFVFVVPEWGGMAPPLVKNFFLLCEQNELAHKPALLIAVSDGEGGGHLIAELRLSGYKNTYIAWIPIHVIIRQVTQTLSDLGLRQDYLSRLNDGVRCLVLYAQALASVRQRILEKHENAFGQ